MVKRLHGSDAGVHARETEPPLGQTTLYPRVPLRPRATVFGRGSTLVIRDESGSTGAGAALSNERRYESDLLDDVRMRFAGRTVTVREVFDAARFGLLGPAASGLSSAYAVRDVLLILSAMGFATVDASSAEPCFTLRALREV